MKKFHPMEYLYLFIVIVLIILAISDLVVGVSNDAVNFVNSAVGSRAATFRTIMIIAALGVLVGSTFSSGMMEIARKGIFNPEQFYFNEIMIIFLAVMITDVILLDLFNTAGLPTSTTVSLVFELLGASVCISAIKIIQQEGSLQQFAQYINAAKVTAIITGILISIAIAFTVGSVVQYFVRLIFTFNFEKKIRYLGSVWGGIAISVMVYFLFIKGAKGSSFLSKDLVEWFVSNTLFILGVTFGGVTIIFQILYWLFRIDILKLVVLAGTFCLAMAFAGNDLVNFIGVPLAGLEAFQAMQASGGTPEAFSMAMLSDPVKTPTLFLLLAGLVMVLTLFLSKKARTVTQTEVNLAKQDEGDESFQSSIVSRGIVNLFLMLNQALQVITPGFIQRWIDSRFKKPKKKKKWRKEDRPAFDMVRASVNLMVSSILIALGTSLKLPLSTTYVTFMVAMGTSLSDRAWGRESAVYRVNGVITVVGGWFFTAFSAFTASCLFALAIYHGGAYAIIALIVAALFFAYRTNLYHKNKLTEEKAVETLNAAGSSDLQDLADLSKTGIVSALKKTEDLYISILSSFAQDSRKKLYKQEKKLKELNREVKLVRKHFYGTIQTYGDATGAGIHFHGYQHHLTELSGCINRIYKQVFDYMINRHHPVPEATAGSLKDISRLFSELLLDCSARVSESRWEDQEDSVHLQQKFNKSIEKFKKEQVIQMQENESGTRLNMLLLDIMQDTSDMVTHASRMRELQAVLTRSAPKE